MHLVILSLLNRADLRTVAEEDNSTVPFGGVSVVGCYVQSALGSVTFLIMKATL